MKRLIKLLMVIIVLFTMINSVSYAQNQWTRPSELKMEIFGQKLKGEGFVEIDECLEPFMNVINNKYANKATFHLYSVCDVNNYPYPYYIPHEEILGAITIKNSPYLINITYESETNIIARIYKGIGEKYDLDGVPFYRSHQLIDEYRFVGIAEESIIDNIVSSLLKLR